MNIVTVNFNTPELIDALVDNVSMYGTHRITVVDNSTVKPCNDSDKYERIDNTNLEFDDYVTPGRQLCREYGITCYGGSYVHAHTVQKLYDIETEPFLLMDSDFILKCDPEKIVNYDTLFSGECSNDRVMPMCLFINVPKCKANGVRFFDGTSICPFSNHDTGYTLFNDCVGHPITQFALREVGYHLGAASYTFDGKPNYETMLGETTKGHTTKASHLAFIYACRACIPNWLNIINQYRGT